MQGGEPLSVRSSAKRVKRGTGLYGVVLFGKNSATPPGGLGLVEWELGDESWPRRVGLRGRRAAAALLDRGLRAGRKLE